MMVIVLLVISVITGGYFAFRYLSLVWSLRKITEDVRRIRQDPQQNHMLRLPVPNTGLEKLLCSLNELLETVQKERKSFQQREKAFQKQIESVSHDLRTPLTVMLGYLKLYQKNQADRIADDGELAETIAVLKQKAEAMKKLTGQFYDFSRLAAEDYDLSVTEVDVSRLLRESLAGSFQILEQAQLQITFDLPEHPVWVFGEEAALERIFSNLFQNAGRYSEALFHMEIKEETNTASILFVNDTKMISEEDLQHLFDRFYMQDLARSRGGTGLGLTIARALAEKMGGTLEAELRPQECAEPEGEDRTMLCLQLKLQKVP